MVRVLSCLLVRGIMSLRRCYGTMPLYRHDSIVTAILHHIQSPPGIDRKPLCSPSLVWRVSNRQSPGTVYAMLKSRERNSRGDFMNNKNGKLSWTGWVVGGASLLLLFSAGLELFVQQTLGHNSVATVILALSLAFWSSVLGLGVLVFLAVWWLVEWGYVWVKRAAISSDASVGPRSQHLEKPESRDPQYNSTKHGACCS